MTPGTQMTDMKDPMQLVIKLTKLEEHLSSMQQNFTASQNNSSQSMMALQSEVRHIGESLSRLGAVAEMQVSDRDSIKRIWERIEANERGHHLRWDQFFDEHEKYREATSERMSSTRSKVDRILAVAFGVSVTVGVAMTIVYDTNAKLQAANEQRQQKLEARLDRSTESDDARLDRIEIHLAGDSARPFRR